MFPFWFVFLGIALHFLFDWILQPRIMAQEKTKIFRMWFAHVMIVWAGAFILYMTLLPSTHASTLPALCGSILYACEHGVQDAVIWRGYEQHVEMTGADPINDDRFFFTIAVDQTIHLGVLFAIATQL
jgi:hypothetical protein